MESPKKFLLPSPNFDRKLKLTPASKPHFLSPSGMTLHAREQPPPMYGKRGATFPSRYLQDHSKAGVKVDAVMHIERQLCEACDMELQSEDDLRRHRAQHEHCPVDGCKYRGHPTVMDKHVTTFHSSGLFDKFKKLSTPEEIAAWREERRRKYPTLENVLMRQRAQEQRQKRGERLEANKSRFGNKDDRKRAKKNLNTDDNTRQTSTQNREAKNQNNNKFKGNKRRRRPELDRPKQRKLDAPIAAPEINRVSESLCVEEEPERSCCGVMMFSGTSRLKDYKHMKTKKQVEVNALSNLLGMYGTDDEDDIESDSEAENSNNETAVVQAANEFTTATIACLASATNKEIEKAPVVEGTDFKSFQMEILTKEDNIAFSSSHTSSHASALTLKEQNTTVSTAENVVNTNSDDEAPEEMPIERTTNLPSPPISQAKHALLQTASGSQPERQYAKIEKIDSRKSGLNYRTTRLRKQNTMLRKLLEPDIRHERNVLLQCVRYVCENKFFGIGQDLSNNNR